MLIVPAAGATKTSVLSSHDRLGCVPCIPLGSGADATSFVPSPLQTPNHESAVIIPIIGGIIGGIIGLAIGLNVLAIIRA